MQAAISAVERHIKKEVTPFTVKRGDGDELQLYLGPDGKVIDPKRVTGALDANKFRERPERIVGTAVLTSLDSFIAHVIRFKDTQSAVFLEEPKLNNPNGTFKLHAVFDYHQGATLLVKANDLHPKDLYTSDARAPRFGKHRALYEPEVSQEWTAWMGAKQPMNQETFAAFIENRVADIQDPSVAGANIKEFAEKQRVELADPGTMMVLSRGLSMRVEQTVEKIVKLSSGEAQMVFSEKHVDKNGDAPNIPSAFFVSIPAFRGGRRFQMPARLRYQLRGGQILWSVELYRMDIVLEHVIATMTEQVSKETSLPFFRGLPEPAQEPPKV